MTRKSAEPPTAGASVEPKEGGRVVVQPSVLDIMASLDLSPHREGGYFRETYRATVMVSTANGRRPTSTAILYLLTTPEPSRFHRLRSDEVCKQDRSALSAEQGGDSDRT